MANPETPPEPKLHQVVLSPTANILTAWVQDHGGPAVREIKYVFVRGNGKLPKAWWTAVKMEADLQGGRDVETLLVPG